MKVPGFHSGCCGYSDIIRGIAMPYDPVPIAIERYETLYAGHDPMWIRERFKRHYQNFWGCDDGQADAGEYEADELIATGKDPVDAWHEVYDRTEKIPACIASRAEIEAEMRQRIEDRLGYEISE